MPQVRGYEVEHSVLQHEAVGDTAFVPDSLCEAFGDIARLDLCHVVLQGGLDEADQEHLPHADERLVQVDKTVLFLGEELLYLLYLVVPVVSLALLGAHYDQVVLLSVGKELRSVF